VMRFGSTCVSSVVREDAPGSLHGMLSGKATADFSEKAPYYAILRRDSK